MSEIRRKKTVEDSRAQQVHIVMPPQCNPSFRLFGGVLMQWIDVVAAVVARRHCGCEVITAAVEQLVFEAPAKLNDVVIVDGRLTYVGRTSMEVCVDTYVEDCETDTRQLVNHAFLTMVAIGKDKRPAVVPELLTQTAEEAALYAEGKERRELRLRKK